MRMDRKQRVYESLKEEIEERERKLRASKKRKLTTCEIERLVYRYRDLQLSMLEEYNLTKQEKMVAFYILFGISYDHISRLMILERTTISYHAGNIFKKCYVSNRQDLCLLVLTKMYFAGSDRRLDRKGPKRSDAEASLALGPDD